MNDKWFYLMVSGVLTAMIIGAVYEETHKQPTVQQCTSIGCTCR